MGTILIHAGMPKTGSTAVQQFLRRSRSLLESRGITVAVATLTDEGLLPLRVHEHETGNVNSFGVVPLMLRFQQPATKPLVMRALTEGLDRLADKWETVVLTSESLAQPFWQIDRDVLDHLEGLASRHPVRVAYYVRPQHTALEAAWRQWGFRSRVAPSAYIERRAKHLHYFETQTSVHLLAPGVDFVVRPHRRDLLEAGDVVIDFARYFLGLDAGLTSAFEDTAANVGLPLEIINLLQVAPDDMLGQGPHDNRRLNMIEKLFDGIETPLSEEVRRGRRILQGWSHDRFEDSNMRLISRLEWPADSFVPATGEVVDSLAPLDTLWHPTASPIELQAFFRLLDLQVAFEESRADKPK